MATEFIAFEARPSPEDIGVLVTGNPPAIVVIDDSPSSISLYRRSINGLAVELSTFESTDDSLSHLATHGADLVFLDILMREKDGLSLLSELRGVEGHRDTAVVIVTSKDYFQDRARAKQLGALDYLVKPLRSQEIREIICRYTDAQPVDNTPAT